MISEKGTSICLFLVEFMKKQKEGLYSLSALTMLQSMALLMILMMQALIRKGVIV